MKNFPSKQEIIEWVSNNPNKISKRDIARAFGVKGAKKVDLKRILKELQQNGDLQKRRKPYRDPERLAPVSILQVLAPDSQGDLFAQPVEWSGEGGLPLILLSLRQEDPALGEGDRILARLSEVHGHSYQYEGRLIRRIANSPTRVFGIFMRGQEGGEILPIERGSSKNWQVAKGETNGAQDGELVEAEPIGAKNRIRKNEVKIVSLLGDPSAPKAVSLIAIQQHNIRNIFPDEVIAEAAKAKPVDPAKRTDLSHLSFVTIDPADARDRDDAIYASADKDSKNKGGHIIWVAIADVAAYVAPDSALDIEARKRGNSTYFPDRVVPMLPDKLSADLCSLHENVPRACIAVRLVLDADGNKLSHSFSRCLINSAASLNYTEVQRAIDGQANEKTAPLIDKVIKPLFAAYISAKLAKSKRQPLDLDLPERRIEISDDGVVSAISFKERLDTHRLVEEFMILANVAAAEELTKRRQPLVFRVHEEPSPEKLKSLREVAQASGFVLAKGQVLQTSHLNSLLRQAEGTDFDELINISTLRSMTQAYYSRENFGHFGLALKSYTHFTSPIRRYADLIVHRALITAHGWGDDGLRPQDLDSLGETATHISETERRSMTAERDTTDRYLASYLSEKVGGEFSGRVSGIARFGAFIKLDETGADGLIPVRTLGREYFEFNPDTQSLLGTDTGFSISMGQRVTVRLSEAVPETGGILLELLSVEGKKVPQAKQSYRRGTSRRSVKSPRRKHSRKK